MSEHNIEKFVPQTFEFVKEETMKKDKRAVVFSHPTVQHLAKNLCSKYDAYFREGLMSWDHFADGTPNFEFEDPENLRGKNVVMIFNFQNLHDVMDQYLLASILPRQNIRQFDIVIPFFGPATMERVEREGCLATAEPCLKLISSIEPTSTGRTKLHFYDIHAIVERFYIRENCVVNLQTALPALMKKITFIDPILAPLNGREFVSAIAFPDDGAYKRFGKMDLFEAVPAIICAKIRDGDTRKIIIRDIVRENPRMWTGMILIIDDLVQSGGTLMQCRNALIAHRKGDIKIAAYCTHGVFPRDSWKKFSDEMDQAEHFDRFYVTNSITSTCNLRGKDPFVVLDLEDCMAVDLQRSIACDPSITSIEPSECSDDPCRVYVASSDRDKQKAAFYALQRFNEPIAICDKISVYGVDIKSTPEQPIGEEEIQKCSLERLNSLVEVVKADLPGEGTERVLFVSMVHGLVEKEGKYYDRPCVVIRDLNSGKEATAWGESVFVPEEFVNTVKENKQTITAGSLFNKEFGWSAGSWHKFLNTKERWVILADTALDVLNQLN